MIEARSTQSDKAAAWSEVYLLLRPYIWPRDERERQEVFFGLTMLAAAKSLNLATPFLYKSSVDALTSGSTEAVMVLPLAFIFGYGAARLGLQIVNYSRAIVVQDYMLRMTDDVRRRFFEHLFTLSLRFHLDRNIGALNMVALRGVIGMRYILENVILNIAPMVVEIALVCFMLTALYEPLYAGVVLLTIAFYVVCTHYLTQAQGGLARAIATANDDTDTATLDSLLNYETVKYFVKERHELTRFDGKRHLLREAFLNHIRGWQRLAFYQGLIITCGVVVVTIMAALDVMSSHMKVGDYVLINTYFLQLFMPLNALGSVYNESKRAIVDMEAILRIFRTAPEVLDAPNAEELKIDGGELCFENVHFAYDPDREILKGTTFTVPAGKKIAVVGPTGAGKTTIARLLFRFYDVKSGRILIDGQDISRVTQESLRRVIGVVPQDTVLFNDTLHYNIAYGSLEERLLPAGDVEAAAQIARLHDFITSLPERYATKVGERGLKLSGGEKQRVAIARALLKAPRIFLLDEATSALDSGTEAEILGRLNAIASNQTTLVIAHRLSTVVDADEIIVLDKGLIAEHGSHQRLLGANGLYASMWGKQHATAAKSMLGQEASEHPIMNGEGPL
ncbi:MAG: ABC transporter ATP-binding protein/permease [Methylocystis sp.]